MKREAIALVMLLASWVSSAAADQLQKPYVDLGLGYVHSASAAINHQSVGLSRANTMGFDLDLGFNLIKHIAIEAGFLKPFHKPTYISDGNHAAINLYNYYGAVKISDAFISNTPLDLFIKAGVGYTSIHSEKISNHELVGRAGFVGAAGVQYAFDDGAFSLGVDYMIFATEGFYLDSKDQQNACLGPQYIMTTLSYRLPI